MTALFYIALTFFIFLCALICFIVLIQESKSLGLGSSFGGDPGDSVFGTSTADVLKKFTSWLATIFIIGSVVLSFWTASLARPKKGSSSIQIEEIQGAKQ